MMARQAESPEPMGFGVLFVYCEKARAPSVTVCLQLTLRGPLGWYTARRTRQTVALGRKVRTVAAHAMHWASQHYRGAMSFMASAALCVQLPRMLTHHHTVHRWLAKGTQYGCGERL